MHSADRSAHLRASTFLHTETWDVADLSAPGSTETALPEWADAFLNGRERTVLQGADPELAMVGRASRISRDLFHRHTRDGTRASTGGGDHFAKPLAHDRLWVSLEKGCQADAHGPDRDPQVGGLASRPIALHVRQALAASLTLKALITAHDAQARRGLP